MATKLSEYSPATLDGTQVYFPDVRLSDLIGSGLRIKFDVLGYVFFEIDPENPDVVKVSVEQSGSIYRLSAISNDSWRTDIGTYKVSSTDTEWWTAWYQALSTDTDQLTKNSILKNWAKYRRSYIMTPGPNYYLGATADDSVSSGLLADFYDLDASLLENVDLGTFDYSSSLLAANIAWTNTTIVKELKVLWNFYNGSVAKKYTDFWTAVQANYPNLIKYVDKNKFTTVTSTTIYPVIGPENSLIPDFLSRKNGTNYSTNSIYKKGYDSGYAAGVDVAREDIIKDSLSRPKYKRVGKLDSFEQAFVDGEWDGYNTTSLVSLRNKNSYAGTVGYNLLKSNMGSTNETSSASTTNTMSALELSDISFTGDISTKSDIQVQEQLALPNIKIDDVFKNPEDRDPTAPAADGMGRIYLDIVDFQEVYLFPVVGRCQGNTLVSAFGFIDGTSIEISANNNYLHELATYRLTQLDQDKLGNILNLGNDYTGRNMINVYRIYRILDVSPDVFSGVVLGGYTYDGAESPENLKYFDGVYDVDSVEKKFKTLNASWFYSPDVMYYLKPGALNVVSDNTSSVGSTFALEKASSDLVAKLEAGVAASDLTMSLEGTGSTIVTYSDLKTDFATQKAAAEAEASVAGTTEELESETSAVVAGTQSLLDSETTSVNDLSGGTFEISSDSEQVGMPTKKYVGGLTEGLGDYGGAASQFQNLSSSKEKIENFSDVLGSVKGGLSGLAGSMLGQFGLGDGMLGGMSSVAKGVGGLSSAFDGPFSGGTYALEQSLGNIKSVSKEYGNGSKSFTSMFSKAKSSIDQLKSKMSGMLGGSLGKMSGSVLGGKVGVTGKLGGLDDIIGESMGSVVGGNGGGLSQLQDKITGLGKLSNIESLKDLGSKLMTNNVSNIGSKLGGAINFTDKFGSCGSLGELTERINNGSILKMTSGNDSVLSLSKGSVVKQNSSGGYLISKSGEADRTPVVDENGRVVMTPIKDSTGYKQVVTMDEDLIAKNKLVVNTADNVYKNFDKSPQTYKTSTYIATGSEFNKDFVDKARKNNSTIPKVEDSFRQAMVQFASTRSPQNSVLIYPVKNVGDTPGVNKMENDGAAPVNNTFGEITDILDSFVSGVEKMQNGSKISNAPGIMEYVARDMTSVVQGAMNDIVKKGDSDNSFTEQSIEESFPGLMSKLGASSDQNNVLETGYSKNIMQQLLTGINTKMASALTKTIGSFEPTKSVSLSKTFDKLGGIISIFGSADEDLTVLSLNIIKNAFDAKKIAMATSDFTANYNLLLEYQDFIKIITTAYSKKTDAISNLSNTIVQTYISKYGLPTTYSSKDDFYTEVNDKLTQYLEKLKITAVSQAVAERTIDSVGQGLSAMERTSVVKNIAYKVTTVIKSDKDRALQGGILDMINENIVFLFDDPSINSILETSGISRILSLLEDDNSALTRKLTNMLNYKFWSLDGEGQKQIGEVINKRVKDKENKIPLIPKGTKIVNSSEFSSYEEFVNHSSELLRDVAATSIGIGFKIIPGEL